MSLDNVKRLLKEVETLKINLFNGDFLRTWDHTLDHIKAVIYVAEILEELYRKNISSRVFDGAIGVSIFRDKSTRTRFSFASAASLLGLTPIDLDESKSQVSHGETARETATMISFLTEVIGIRDDLFLGEGHKGMKEYADAIKLAFRKGVLPRRTGVINLQCDEDHPTQTLADLLHLSKTYGGIESLKGKKIAVTWAFSPAYGKPMSVPQGIIALMTRFGMNVTLAHPEGYNLIPEIEKIAEKNAKRSGGSFKKVNSMEEAFENADIVYPKSWAPVSVMKKRTELLRKGEAGIKALQELEKECIARNLNYKKWECNEKMMKLTSKGKALYMHCLPADITGVNCKAGEVSSGVFDRYRYATYREAEHKLYIIGAMILLLRFEDVPAVINRILRRDDPLRINF